MPTVSGMLNTDAMNFVEWMVLMELLEELRSILHQDVDRATKAARIAQAIRAAGPFRWVGIYEVDLQRGTVSNIAWNGPNAPAFPTFATSEGLTSRAIARKKTVNVGDVASDKNYLTALDSTRSEIIVPVLDGADGRAIGTIDVESERLNAFDSSTQSLLEECANVLKSFWTQHR